MNSLNLFFLLLLCLNNNYASECYLQTKNNFMKFYLKLDNFYLKNIFIKLGCSIDKIQSITCNKIYNLSYKYNTLSYEEKEMLEVIGFFF
jgi:hypothetical protein